MRFKIIAALSLVLNLGLLTHIFAGQSLTDSTVDNRIGLSDQTTQSLSPSQRDQVFIDQLVGRGLDSHQVNLLVFDKLQTELLGVQTDNDSYWLPTSSSDNAASLQQQLKAERALRLRLTALLGEQARYALAFQQVFRPFASQMDFLTSEDQIALRESQLQQQISVLSNSEPGSEGSPTAAGLSLQAFSGVLHEQSISEILGPDETFEYSLRYSPLADQLRLSGVVFTEPAFRQVYGILAKTQNSAQLGKPNPQALIDQRNQLTQLLGKNNTVKVLAALDKRFKNLQIAGQDYDLTQEQLLAAYEIISDSEMAMIEGYFVRKINAEEGINLIRTAARNRESQLINHFGEDVARELMAKFSRGYSAGISADGIVSRQ